MSVDLKIYAVDPGQLLYFLHLNWLGILGESPLLNHNFRVISAKDQQQSRKYDIIVSKTNEHLPRIFAVVLLMKEILHQLIGSLSHY